MNTAMKQMLSVFMPWRWSVIGWRRACAIAAALSCVAMVASSRCLLDLSCVAKSGDRYSVGLRSGLLSLKWHDSAYFQNSWAKDNITGPDVLLKANRTGQEAIALPWRPYHASDAWGGAPASCHSYYFPLWVPVLASLLGIGFTHGLVVGRRQAAPNSCRKCGYDLTGNASPTCPECGFRRRTPKAG